MGTTNLESPLFPNGERILLKLHQAKVRRDCTKASLRDTAGLAGEGVSAGLTELLMHGLVEQDDDVFLLTPTGRSLAKKLTARPAPNIHIDTQNNVRQTVKVGADAQVRVDGVLDSKAKSTGAIDILTASPTGYNGQYQMSVNGSVANGHTVAMSAPQYLSAQAHPARANCAPPRRPETERLGAAPSVRFLLAFRNMRDALPIPVFDQDKLGRGAPDIQISLNDTCISAMHCRFHVRKSKTGTGYDLLVEDLASRNGVQVNDVPIEPNKPAQLRHGYRLAIGSMIFVVLEVPE